MSVINMNLITGGGAKYANGQVRASQKYHSSSSQTRVYMKVQGLSFKPKALAILPDNMGSHDLEATFKIYNDDYNIVASMEASYELGSGGVDSGTFLVGSSDRNYETTLFSDGFEVYFWGYYSSYAPQIRWFAVG